MLSSDISSPAEIASRVCFFAHFDADGLIGEHVLLYLHALRAAGFRIWLGSPSPIPSAERRKLDGIVEEVLLRENFGMDFGSWIDLLDHFPPPDDALVLLANDSVYAPVGDLSSWLERLLATPADFYGAVASGEITPHLQSWFVLLRPAAHRSAAFRKLMRPGAITPELNKTEIVDRFEMGMSGRLAGAGLRFAAAYDWRRDSRVACRLPFNPMHLLWDELVASGTVPFLKVELLRYNPANVANVESWPALVGQLAPALTPLIRADLDRRGKVGASTPIVRPASATRLKGAPDPIYRHQLRPMVVRDFRTARARQRLASRWNALTLSAAWHYSRLGRIVKWSVLDGLSALRRGSRRANDR